MPPKRIFIANNGLSAIKFINSMTEFMHATNEEFAFSGMATKEDAAQEYVKHVDVRIVESGPPEVNYCNVALVVSTAKEMNATFVYPGWGHLSENPELAYEVELNGMVFLGPAWYPMWVCGNKIASLLLAELLDVPVIPYSIDECLKSRYESILCNTVVDNNNNSKSVMNNSIDNRNIVVDSNKNRVISNNSVNSVMINSIDNNSVSSNVVNNIVVDNNNRTVGSNNSNSLMNNSIDNSRIIDNSIDNNSAIDKTVLNKILKNADRFKCPYILNEFVNIISKPSTLELAFPILLKSVSTGGGKGVYKIETPSQFKKNLSFITDSFYAVELRSGGRHIEIQIISDGKRTVSLGARDCTTQRRYQKVIETSTRNRFVERMESDAVRLVSSVEYVGLATVEFLVFKEEYFFMEINTRLQVEHTVTELEKGINIPSLLYLVCSGSMSVSDLIDYQVNSNSSQVNSDGSMYNSIGSKYKSIGSNYNSIGSDNSCVNNNQTTVSNNHVLTVSNNHVLNVCNNSYVIGVRIIAEDDEMVAMNGRLRVNQSVQNCTSYFSITDGSLHEYNETQFGHVFVVGRTREDAIKKIVIALKCLKIDYVKTPIKRILAYLQSNEFVNDEIDTSTYENCLISSCSNNCKCDGCSLSCSNSDCISFTNSVTDSNNDNNKNMNNICFTGNCIDLNNNPVLAKNTAIKSVTTDQPITNHSSNNCSYLQPFCIYCIVNTGTEKKKMVFQIANTVYKVTTYPILYDYFILEINKTYALFHLKRLNNSKYAISHNGVTIITEIFEENSFTYNNEIVFVNTTVESNSVFMPRSGRVVTQFKQCGSFVEIGEPVLEYESMKMRQMLRAPFSGKVVFVEEVCKMVKKDEIVCKIENGKDVNEMSTFKFTKDKVELIKDKVGLTYGQNGQIHNNQNGQIHNNKDDQTAENYFCLTVGFNKNDNELYQYLSKTKSHFKEVVFFSMFKCEVPVDFYSVYNMDFKRVFYILDILNAKVYSEPLFEYLMLKILNFVSTNKLNSIETSLYKLSLKYKNKELIKKILSILDVVPLQPTTDGALITFSSESLLMAHAHYLLFYESKEYTGMCIKSEEPENEELLHFMNTANLLECRVISKKQIFEYSLYRGYIEYKSVDLNRSDNLQKYDWRIGSLPVEDEEKLLKVYSNNSSCNSCSSSATNEIKTNDEKLSINKAIDNDLLIDSEISNTIEKSVNTNSIIYNALFSILTNNPLSIDYLKERKAALRNNTIYYKDMINLFSYFFSSLTPLRLTLLNNEYVVEEGVPTAKIGMVAYKFVHNNRECVLIMNDITVSNGSFSTDEYVFYYLISKYCLTHNVPRVYVASNSGARIGVHADGIEEFIRNNSSDNQLDSNVNSNVVDGTSDVNDKAVDQLFNNTIDVDDKIVDQLVKNTSNVDDKVIEQLVNNHSVNNVNNHSVNNVNNHSVNSDNNHSVTNDNGMLINNNKIISVYGNTSTGPENLSYSALVATVTEQLYDNGFTLTYVTGMSVGIGAYLTRLGRRTIQKCGSSIILTGYKTLNKLNQSEIYKSNEDIGGCKVMGTNGINSMCARNEVEGVMRIKEWLNFYIDCSDGCVDSSNTVDNECDTVNSNTVNSNLNRNNSATSTVNNSTSTVKNSSTINTSSASSTASSSASSSASSFAMVDNPFHLTDRLLIKEGKSKIERKMEVSVDAVKTAINRFEHEKYNELEIVERIFDPNCIEYCSEWARNVIVARGYIDKRSVGVICSESMDTKNVMFYETAEKIAECIEIFNKEGKNLIMICNWKGFSGGLEDMKKGVLKSGSNIVKSLTNYNGRVFVYVPPFGELRGGTFVVFDSKINGKIKVAVHPTAEIGILEPSGLAEIKMKAYGKIVGEEFCKLHDNSYRLVRSGLVEYCAVEELKERICRYFWGK